MNSDPSNHRCAEANVLRQAQDERIGWSFVKLRWNKHLAIATIYPLMVSLSNHCLG